MPPNTNPFVPGKIVKPTDLIGRQEEIRALFSQIMTTQSTSLIGTPHIGKTSLLTYLADPQVRVAQVHDSTSWAFVARNGHSVADETPTTFWRSVLQEALAAWDSQALELEVRPRLRGETLSNATLDATFREIQRNGKMLVLLLDELEDLLGSASLSQSQFWGHLRSLASLSPNALCYVTSSRIDPDECAEALKLQSSGSPLFNIARRQRLKPLPESEARQILELAPLPLADRNAILTLAGGNPYLLQMLGALIWEARMAGKRLAGDGYVRFALAILDVLNAHFADTWKYLDQTKGAQTLAVMFTLQELERRTHNLNYLEMASKVFPKPLRALKDAGLLAENSSGHLRLAGGAFAIWVAQNQMGQALDDPETWLRDNEKLAGPITRGQLEELGKKLSSVYGEVKGAGIDLGAAIVKNRLGLP